VNEVDWFRRWPNGGTVYARPDGGQDAAAVSDAVAAIRAAADNAARVMPPVAARWMTNQLRAVAGAISDSTTSWEVVDRWLVLANDINTYAVRARQFVEHEVFLGGSTPDDARYTEAAETLNDALTAGGWLAGAGAAHRTEIRLYGPWQIDRPAARATEVAA